MADREPLDQGRLLAAAEALRTTTAEYERCSRLDYYRKRPDDWREVWGDVIRAKTEAEKELLLAALSLPPGAHLPWH